MANQRTILPEMISVSRNCVFTNQLHAIFAEKLEDADFEILLYEIKPDGTSVFLTTDILRARFSARRSITKMGGGVIWIIGQFFR